MHKVWVLNGPNLNLLGQREPAVYGQETLADVDMRLQAIAEQAGVELACYQHNAEHALIDLIHQAAKEAIDILVFNPAAFTHTSVALRDALLAVKLPFIEVHISHIFAREPFRRHSYFSDIALGVVSGLGTMGYDFALQAAIAYIKRQQTQ